MYNFKFMVISVIVLLQGKGLWSLQDSDVNLEADNVLSNDDTKVEIKFYYESLCPYCRDFGSDVLAPTVLQLDQYLNINLYPYGNAQTTEKEGKYEFTCQHGSKECYGNKLHACAIDVIQNITAAVIFNSCMMSSNQTSRGSDDAAADVCGSLLLIDSSSIKECAKGERGDELLKKYGDESEKADFKYVPYILVNGEEISDSEFIQDICRQLVDPPAPCVKE